MSSGSTRSVLVGCAPRGGGAALTTAATRGDRSCRGTRGLGITCVCSMSSEATRPALLNCTPRRGGRARRRRPRAWWPRAVEGRGPVGHPERPRDGYCASRREARAPTLPEPPEHLGWRVRFADTHSTQQVVHIRSNCSWPTTRGSRDVELAAMQDLTWPWAVGDGPYRRLSRRGAPCHPEGRSVAEEARSAWTGARPEGYAFSPDGSDARHHRGVVELRASVS